MYDVTIVGSGPAGMAAAIYAKRAMLDTLVVDKTSVSGGQILNTYEVDNYPGLPEVTGMDLGKKFKDHAVKLGAEFTRNTITSIEDKGEYKILHGKKGDIETKTVILAMGASNRRLGVPGEDELVGMGVSYCATCDGAFYKDKVVVVVGGGDVALEDAIYLARGCSKVYLVHRRDEFRGAKVLADEVRNTANIELVLDSVVDRIVGSNGVESVEVSNVKTGEKRTLEVQGAFIAVGTLPQTDKIEGLPDMDERGYIIAGEDGVTSIPGIFVAGDCRTKQLRQVVTAASDGANCVVSAERYL